MRTSARRVSAIAVLADLAANRPSTPKTRVSAVTRVMHDASTMALVAPKKPSFPLPTRMTKGSLVSSSAVAATMIGAVTRMSPESATRPYATAAVAPRIATSPAPAATFSAFQRPRLGAGGFCAGAGRVLRAFMRLSRPCR